ncbi:hypothetical protein AK830_g2729 [Neonectria ditissima]|uniref:Uncharacterized protein n=1 Tax=Neonectria ditissima TaxID=78410 RepID=A0A0P7BSY5_9HYPO|nr:hypothetical protein AK830_g2729 [Neonectria ditissima]
MTADNLNRVVRKVPAEIWLRVCSFLHVEEYGQCGVCPEDSFGQADEAYSLGIHRKLPKNALYFGPLNELDTSRGDSFSKYSAIVSEFRRFYPQEIQNPKQDLCNFRLVCKQFSILAMHYTHKNLCFFLTEEHLQKLYDVAEDPDMPRAIRALRYYATDYTTQGEMTQETYTSFYRVYTSSEDLMARTIDLSRDLVEYGEYSEIYDEQRSLQDDDEDVKCFANVFSLLLKSPSN